MSKLVMSGFHVVDYILFGCTLAISLAIGIYYSCVGGKQKTTKEYFLGDKKLKPIPVAFSLFMSYISAVLVLGNTAEMYTAGIQYWLAGFGSCLAFIFSALVFVPFFYRLQLTSSFEVCICFSIILIFKFICPKKSAIIKCPIR